MKNYPVRIRTFVCLLGMALLLAGCADSDLAAAHPQVVRKKISSPVEAPPPSQAAARPAPAAPAAEQTPPLVASVKPQDAAAPSPLPPPEGCRFGAAP